MAKGNDRPNEFTKVCKEMTLSAEDERD